MKNFVCEECGKEFEKKDSLKFHVRDRHGVKTPEKPAELVSDEGAPKKSFKLPVKYLTIVPIILLAGFFLLTNTNNPSKDSQLIGNSVNLPLPIPEGEIHYHPRLTIEIFGENIVIPANVGIRSNAHLPVHTHDNTGKLHWEVAKPTLNNMRLGYFFEVAWNKVFNSTCIFDYCNGKDGTLKFYVNGEQNYEYENYYVKDGDELKIVFD